MKEKLIILTMFGLIVSLTGAVEDLSMLNKNVTVTDLSGVDKEIFGTQFFKDDLLGDYSGYTPIMTAFLTGSEFNTFEDTEDLYTRSMAEFLRSDENPTSAKSIDDFLYKKEVLDSEIYGKTDSMLNFSL